MRRTFEMKILEYMDLDPNDYCGCDDPAIVWTESGKYLECCDCVRPLPPDYENSLDAQQPVIEKLIKDGDGNNLFL